MKKLLILLTGILISGCATKVLYSEDELNSLFNHSNSPVLWSPNIEELSLFLKGQPAEKSVFSFYCSNGIQKRKLLTKIQAVISAPPKGISLDKAIVIQNQKQENLISFIKLFYRNIFLKDVWTKSGIGLETEQSEFFTVRSTESELYPYSTTPSLLLKSSDDKALNLVFGLPHFTIQYDSKKFFIPKYFIVGNGGHKSGFVMITSNTINAYENSNSESSEPFNTTTDLQLIEAVLTNTFTILPEDENLFSTQNLTSEKNLAAIWEHYLIQNTSYKEAQTSDPNIIRYEISLDLNGFCKRARPITDLLSK